MDGRDCDGVVFLDPDIVVTARLDPILNLLDEKDILLTPKVIAPALTDEAENWALAHLHTGVFNTGFVAVAKRGSGPAFLNWWGGHLHRNCLALPRLKQFTDQKAVDLVPAIFNSVGVIRHPGANLGFWNLYERSVTREDGGLRVNGEPLLFFHYSGFKASSEVRNRMMGAWEPNSVNPALHGHKIRMAARLACRPCDEIEELAAAIVMEIKEQTISTKPPQGYPFNYLACGDAINWSMRLTYHLDPDLRAAVPRPFADPQIQQINKLFSRRDVWKSRLELPIIRTFFRPLVDFWFDAQLRRAIASVAKIKQSPDSLGAVGLDHTP